MKKRLFSPLLAAALAAAVALTAAALPAFADGGEETPITIGQSQEQQAECTCTALCTGDSVNADCPVCGAEGADLAACEGLEALPATLSNALPATALAAVPEGQIIYVGNESVTNGGYWTTDSNGNVTAYTGGDTPTDNYIHYDVANNTLTLHNATIKESVSTNTSTFIAGAAIGVLNQNGDAELTITLEGTNTIAEVGKGIYVLANSTGGATLTITGDGSLDASARQTGIWVQSNNGDAALFIQNAKVEATGTNTAGYGVNVQSSNSSTAALTVDGGSLTASGSPGILYDSIGSGTVPKTTALTISNSAIVDAREGGIGAGYIGNLSGVSPAGDSVGIVFDGDDGTVYGSVELQEDLEIGEGESLTLDDGASLNTGNCTLTVNGGTLTDDVTGDVIYKVTGVSLDKTNLNLNPGKGGTLIATITPGNATNQNVTWESSDTKVVTVDNGLVTAVAEGTATITVTTEDGNKTATCTVIVTNNGSGPVVPPQPSDPAPSQPEGGGSSSAGAGSSGSAAPRQQSPVVHNVSNSSAYRKGEYEFWMKVRTKIVSANPGEVIEVNARDNDKMPNSVMQALAAKEDVTLRIRWNGGEEIVIPSAAALQEKMRMFYPLSYLAKFDFAQTPAKRVK